MNVLASTIIATPLTSAKIKLIEQEPGATDLTLEVETPTFGLEVTILPRDAAWVEYLAQVNEYFK